MFLRWLHKSWKFIWGIVLTLFIAIVIIIGGSLALLQLDVTQDYLIGRIEQQVNQNFEEQLSIGEVGGFPPFNFTLQDVVLTQDSTETDTLAYVASIQNNLDIWSLFQNKIGVNGFELNQPEVWLEANDEGRIVFLQQKHNRQDTTTKGFSLGDIEILAPSLRVIDGTLHLKNVAESSSALQLPSSTTVSEINTNLFLEWSEDQRFLDIESFSAETGELAINKLSMTGQVYSDQEYLEFNSFYFKLGRTEISVNGRIEGVDLDNPNFINQLATARYNLDVESKEFYPDEFSETIPVIPGWKGPFTLNLETKGGSERLSVDELTLGRGESLFRLEGVFWNLNSKHDFRYHVNIDSLKLREQDIPPKLDSLITTDYDIMNGLALKGTTAGTMDTMEVELDMYGPFGSLNIEGGSRLKEPYHYKGRLTTEDMDISWLAASYLDTTSIDLEAEVEGTGFDLKKANTDFEALVTDSRVNNQNIRRLQLNSSLADGRWLQQYNYWGDEKKVNGFGMVDLSRERPPIFMKGSAENINLSALTGDTTVAETKLNFEYKIDAEGLDPNNVEGKVAIDVSPSIINGDTVQAHQFYADIATIGERRRSFRLTSSLFDMTAKGQLYTEEIRQQLQYWSAYIKNHYRQEITMDSSEVPRMLGPAPEHGMVLDGNIRTKNLSLIKKYLPYSPILHAQSQLSFNVNAASERLLFSVDLEADSLHYNQWKAKNSRIQLTGSFRSDEDLKDFSSIDLEANIADLKSQALDMQGVGIDLKLNEDSLQYRQQVENIGKNARFNFVAKGSLADSAIVATIEEFYLGNENYEWSNQETPTLILTGPERVVFKDFKFMSQDEYFQLRGALSPDHEDSLSFSLQDINLGRISELVDGRIGFSGILNGNLVTRSLTREPTIQGKLNVGRLKLNDRIVGDVAFQSDFNSEMDRFDTQISVETDPEKYADYLKTNDEVQQDFTLDGYILTPKEEVQQDSLFYFDADFEEIDMWIVPLIVDDIFQQVEGKATGKGYITGNFNNFDFHGNFDTEDVFVKPRFLNTNYFLNGQVIVDRHDGVILDSLSVMDTKGGTGTLWGTIDLNDFNPITYLDLNFDINGLEILNSTMDPDVPFFGNISGTGMLQLAGSNTDMTLRSPDPVKLTDESHISIPLMEETELSESGKFIRFVDSFEDYYNGSTENDSARKASPGSEEQFRAWISELTFSERFNLDLRFNTNHNIGVSLIFDPVTGDVLKARGSGQMRITMKGQEMQMFGRYRISNGSYQFVTGEIISRKLDLEPGGTIVWEGAPDNARLDISAVYRARPNVATLNTRGSIGDNNNRSQQVPINLIVEISGTLNSVRNNYYFELPSSLDLSSGSTLSYTINQINRDEQQKLLQATSILFTGQFIPTQGAGSGTSSLSQNLTRGSTVFNPLVSNQVISPLLSNQINALLNSDVSRLDIDFNINAYNEVDLGIALRLYNDRLILRREGQITGGGPQTTLGDRIGDLNAIYRISRHLSINAFHRQNQILSSYGTQSQGNKAIPSVDGLGLESNFRFNYWKGLWRTIWGITSEKSAKGKGDDENKNDNSSKETNTTK